MSELTQLNFELYNDSDRANGVEITPKTTLLEYLRAHEHLKGTKYMCLEGGCGCCVVAVTRVNPVTKKTETFAVNSCLVSIFSCQDWKIHTVEGIGNKLKGYHPIQKTLARFNGTQCGFCSPGMVMNMYALYESQNLTMKAVEDSFGGNICRCTGYRPILTAFKSMADDASVELLGKCPDIENLDRCNGGGLCAARCLRKFASGPKWYKAFSLNEIFDVLRQNAGKYNLVAGNTARGVYPEYNDVDFYIDISTVAVLQQERMTNSSLVVGGNKTLRDTIALFRKSARNDKFAYLTKLAEHMEKVAHVAVRNIGTLAGNLSIKNDHNEFASDLFVIFEAAGATLDIALSKTRNKEMTVSDYLTFNMTRKVIRTITFPAMGKTSFFGSYKIMKRAQNAEAYVNAGFLLTIKNEVIQSASLVYGGINPTFVHAEQTEKYLVGKKAFSDVTLQESFARLDQEVQPDDVLPQASPKYRKYLALSLFYKYMLSIAPSSRVSAKNRSGGTTLTRPISTGAQDYQTNESMYPVTQPIPKIDALGQTSGEVEYITDIPDAPNQLFAYFVTAQAPANSVIASIDPSEALSIKGVVACYTSKDVPGDNTFIPKNVNYPPIDHPPTVYPRYEEIFCSGVVQFYFQPVALVVAETHELAELGARMVKVAYTSSAKKPLLNIREVLKAGAKDRIEPEASLKPTRKGTDVKHVIKGTFDTSWQYHYHMETQICLVCPRDDNYDIYPSSQWMDLIQTAVSSVLLIPENKVNVSVKRIGGAFGAKITRNSLLACATAIAAHKLQKPVRMRMTFTTNMDVVGKRFPSSANYEVGVDDKGVIQYLNTDLYLDYGVGGNEPVIFFTMGVFSSSYRHDTWTVEGMHVKTDNHASVWMRAPGDTTIMAMIESIMEHVAMTLEMSPYAFRVANMDPDENKKILQFYNELMQLADYDGRKRAVTTFNGSNRWIKRGVSLIPMTFEFAYWGTFSCVISIYAGDGSVAVTHGGIEVGQGINTKVCQVVAWALGVPLDMVDVKASNTLTAANNCMTGASVTSESICYAALRACGELKERIKPIRDKMPNATWPEVIRECQRAYVDLVGQYMFSPNDPVQNYNIYGVCMSEVEVDVLTGVYQITRVDILEDTGSSTSPLIDIGQIEGAFIMGVGLWTTEETIFTSEGRLLTNRTWTYKVPCAQDIPIDFRVKMPKNNPNPAGVLFSKSSGEPPLCLACAIPLAIRHAISSARADSDPSAPHWYPFKGPTTVENAFLNSLNSYQQYKY